MTLSAAFLKRQAAAVDALKRYPALLLDVPHPQRVQAMRGYKARTYVAWLLEHAGASGKTRACKMIEAAVRRVEEPRLPIRKTQEIAR